MRRLAILATLALALAQTISTGADANECVGAPDQVYRFDVRVEVPAARLDRSRSRDELNQSAFHGPGTNTLGLMQSQLELRDSVQFGAVPIDGGHCYWVQTIDLVIRYRSLDIFVASEYRRDSCAYRAILSHERDHARVARDYLNRFEPRFRQALNTLDIPRPGRPSFTQGKPKTEVRRLVEGLVRPVFDELNATMSRAQAALDTPEQYARIQARCNDW